jgi:nicotinate-nucleotide adenylyltransferase
VSQQVAVFGGSFNPPHAAHVLVAVYVLSVLPIDHLLVVPCYEHPFGKPLAPFEHRLQMSRCAFDWIPRVSVSTVERDLGGASHTVRTLRRLVDTHPDWSLHLVVGSDILAESSRWKGFDEIRKLAQPIVLPRGGFDAEDARATFPEVSSTQIRDALQRGEIERARPWLPRDVLAYALREHLYASSS